MRLTPLSIVTAAGVLMLPLAAFAATYSYVNDAGMVQTEVAPSATEALAIAPDIAPNSGVAVGIVTADASASVPASIDGTYQYVNTDGGVEMESAPNADAAIILPSDRAPTSGVIAVTPATMISPTVTVNVQP